MQLVVRRKIELRHSISHGFSGINAGSPLKQLILLGLGVYDSDVDSAQVISPDRASMSCAKSINSTRSVVNLYGSTISIGPTWR